MNVAGLPGTENASAFVIVLAGMVLVSGGVYAVLKLKKWF
jgi:Mg2+ and Co2+ transporter CorA